jgi:hypothetical protein
MMTSEQIDRTVVTEGPTAVIGEQVVQTDAGTTTVQTDLGQQTVRTDSRRFSTSGPEGAEMTRRIVVLLFGLIQIVIGARFILLLLDARESNGIVSAILNFSQLFVAPFEGVLKTNSLHSAGSTFDMAAVVAFVGWSVIELIVIWIIGIFRREPALPR